MKAKTEPNYFRAFRVNADVIDLEVQGVACDPLTLVREARDGATRDEYGYDQVWCVFDRNSWTAECFSSALQLARQRGMCVAYSNEAFEIWYLLRFEYHQTGTRRVRYQELLTDRLGEPYAKNDRGMYDRLLARQPTAIRNAARLLASYAPDRNPEADNPSTTVHLLVQELNRYIP